MPFIPLLYLAPFIVIAIISAYYKSRSNRLNKIFKEAAAIIGLKHKKYWSPVISGDVDGKAVRIRKGQIYINHKIRINGLMKISYPKQAQSRWPLAGFADNDIRIGDAEFDRNYFLNATGEYDLRAFLNEKVRKMIMKISKRTKLSVMAASTQQTTFELTTGWLKISGVKGIFDEPGKIAELFYLAMEISNDFTDERDLKTRFMENVVTDSQSGVRYYNLRHLGDRYGNDGDVVSLMEQILEDKNLNMQITAAKYCGQKGMEHLERIIIENKDLGDNYILIIISIFSSAMYSAGIPLLMEVYNNSKNEAIHRDILWAFWKFKDASTCDFLLEQMEKTDGDIRLNAVEILGVCGTVESVERMHKAARDSLNPFFRNQVQKAILRIQARLGSVEKGWLSVEGLSETEGALSFDNDANEGALSFDGRDSSEE